MRVGVQEARLSPGPWGRRAVSTAPSGGGLPAAAAALRGRGLGTRGRRAAAAYAKGAAVGQRSAGMPPLPASVMAYWLRRALTHPRDHRGALDVCSL